MVHSTLRDVSPQLGYQLENPATGQASRVLETEVPGGPLDNAAHIYLGNPARRYSIIVEVKSRRDWMYQDSSELYQVLYKAAALKRLLPDESIIPVLVCRRAHLTAFRMLKDLGGYIIESREQWLPPNNSRVEQSALLEVRNELNFLDLRTAPGDWINQLLRRQFATYLPNALPDQAERWGSAGSRYESQYQAIWRGKSLVNLAYIRDGMEKERWFQGGW
jgi:hypothetical protein